MRTFITGALITLAALTSLATTPAAAQAATSNTAAAECNTSSKSQTNDGITVRVFFTNNGTDCYVYRVQALSAQGRKYGHFNLFGPNGWSVDSPTKWWEWGEHFAASRWTIAWPGHLWCGRFYNGDNQQVTGNVCVTV
ncbi:hypothetical protein GCM10010412_100770 [Nonomuraea recticatena]|uniref:Spore-associated protein A n=1 Tax=Nonomuraea recticatena TaxID=46178 RepID=A0ABP6FXF3_9ACTN